MCICSHKEAVSRGKLVFVSSYLTKDTGTPNIFNVQLSLADSLNLKNWIPKLVIWLVWLTKWVQQYQFNEE